MTDPAAPLRLTLNGKPVDVKDVPDEMRLLDLLRWRLELKGTKEGCRSGDCGACSVLVNGESTLSCLTLAREVEGASVETVEGLARSDASRRVAEAFAKAGAVQCGYCTPGFVVAVEGLLRERAGERALSPADLARELGGNLCRCTGYYGILRALSELLPGAPDPSVARSTFEVVPAPPSPSASPASRRVR